MHVDPDSAAFRMRFVEAKAVGDCVAADDCVGVENKRVGAGCDGKSLIVGISKADIFGVFNKNHVGKPFFQIFHRSVAGIVVYNDDFASQVSQRFFGGANSLFEKIFDPIIDNDDGYVDRISH